MRARIIDIHSLDNINLDSYLPSSNAVYTYIRALLGQKVWKERSHLILLYAHLRGYQNKSKTKSLSVDDIT